MALLYSLIAQSKTTNNPFSTMHSFSSPQHPLINTLHVRILREDCLQETVLPRRKEREKRERNNAI